VIAQSDTTSITGIVFDLTLAAGGDSVNLNPNDTTNRTVISYQDSNSTVNNLDYQANVITGDSDQLLEAGELLEVVIDFSTLTTPLTTNKTFTLEIKPPQGSYLVVQRTTPASINQSVINLN
jgi:archaellin